MDDPANFCSRVSIKICLDNIHDATGAPPLASARELLFYFNVFDSSRRLGGPGKQRDRAIEKG